MNEQIDAMRRRLDEIGREMDYVREAHDEPDEELDWIENNLELEDVVLRCRMYNLLNSQGIDPATVLLPIEIPSRGDWDLFNAIPDEPPTHEQEPWPEE